jgi:LPS-assembly lipoprotein
MYMESANGGPAIGPVVIDKIDGKGGYVLKSELEKLLDVERGTGPVRRLVITMTESVGGLGFRVDESASRSDLYLDATYHLYDFDGNEVLRGTMRSIASYDVPSSAYGEITAQDDARERAAETLAEKLRADIAVRLAQKKIKAADVPATTVLPTPGTPASVTPAPVTPILETPTK